MLHAGAVRAMELDINTYWTSFITYRHPGATAPPTCWRAWTAPPCAISLRTIATSSPSTCARPRAATAAAAVIAALTPGRVRGMAQTGDKPDGPHPPTSSGPVPPRTVTTTAARDRSLPPGPPFAVGSRVVTFVDGSRDGHLPRPGAATRGARHNHPLPDASTRTAPLIVFGHGFAVTPAIYSPLLTAWAQAGYVVAAPIFPLGNQNAPGGPNESDLVNQPADMSFVITSCSPWRASRALPGQADHPDRIAVQRPIRRRQHRAGHGL